MRYGSQLGVLVAAGLLIGFTPVSQSAEIPDQSYPADAGGTLLSRVSGPGVGRLTAIEIIGNFLVAAPLGQGGNIRAYDITDPSNPIMVQDFGTNYNAFSGHALIKRDNQVLVNPWTRGGYAVETNSDGSLNTSSVSNVPWRGIDGHGEKAGQYRPWWGQNFSTYGTNDVPAEVRLNGVSGTPWNHIGDTGVVGPPLFMGDIVIYPGEENNSGVAAYRIVDPTKEPVLLDKINLPATHPTLQYRGAPASYGLGGYWAEISGHYLVMPRRTKGSPGVQVVDISDPSSLKLHCEFFARDPKHYQNNKFTMPENTDPMYVGFQDNYIFSEQYKLDITDCSLVEQFKNVDQAKNVFLETSQYSRPVGNLLITGSMGNTPWYLRPIAGGDTFFGSGMGIWVHDPNQDTKPPVVAYHIPEADRTNYPLFAPISISIPETLRSETIIPGQTLTVHEVSNGVVDPNGEVTVDYVLSHTGMLTVNHASLGPGGTPPTPGLKSNATYEVRLAGIEDAVGNVMAPYSYRFSTGSSVDNGGVTPPPPMPTPVNSAPVINNVTRTNEQIITGGSVTLTVSASDGDGDALEYRYRVGSGTYTNWTTNNQFTTVLTSLGTNTVNAQVRDNQGGVTAALENFLVVALTPTPTPSLKEATNSSQLAHNSADNSVWVVNPDNDSVSKIDVLSGSVLGEFTVGDDPRSVAIDANGNIWVTLHGSDSIQILNPNDGNVTGSIDTGYGSAPFGIVMNANNADAYVTLYGSGEVLRIDTNSQQVVGSLMLARTARALALNSSGDTLLVTRFISEENWGEVWQIDTGAWSITRTIPLYKRLNGDSLDDGNGVPNYLSSIIINAAGTQAFVVGKKDNVDRGLLNGIDDLDADNTVRTMLAVIDLNQGQELENLQFDFDNADSPSALTFTANGYLLIAIQGGNGVVVLNVSNTGSVSLAGKIPAGLAPQGVLISADHLYIKNFMDRTVSIVDISGLLNTGLLGNGVSSIVNTVNSEALAADVLTGKQIFYNAIFGQTDPRLPSLISEEGYISCATCHLDGGHDGRTYDFTGRGEGLRNNISLKGRGGVRFGDVHWTGNFDEIHDFENDIRLQFGGTGLMSDADFSMTQETLGLLKAGLSQDLDNLASYVSSLNKMSLPKSPFRNDSGTLDASAESGQVIFEQQGCASCHRGKAFTDGEIHDVASHRSYSGQRLGNQFIGVKTPSLLGLFDSKPYLHDGSAETIADVFKSAGGVTYQVEDEIHTGTNVSNGFYPAFRSGGAVILVDGDSVSVNQEIIASGTGVVAFRYGSSSTATSITVTVDNVETEVQLKTLPQVGGQDVNFSEAKVLVDFPLGSANISLTFNAANNSDQIIIDDITVSDPSQFFAADMHTRVTTLAASEQNNLINYLRQIDQQDAPSDNEAIVLGPLPIDEPDPVPVPVPVPVPAPEPEPEPEPEENQDQNEDANPEEDETEEEGGGGSVGMWSLFSLWLYSLFKSAKL